MIDIRGEWIVLRYQPPTFYPLRIFVLIFNIVQINSCK